MSKVLFPIWAVGILVRVGLSMCAAVIRYSFRGFLPSKK
jgi:hypothetical protein